MKTIFLFSLLFFATSVFSQNLTIEAEKDATLFPLGFSGEHSVFIKKTAYFTNSTIHALVLNNATSDRNFITIHNQPEQQGKGFINTHEHTFVTDKGIFSFIEKTDKTNDTKTMDLVHRNLTGEENGSVNFTVKRYKNKEYSAVRYRYSLSDDQSKVAVVTEMKFSKGVQELINVTMIDLNSMSLLFDKEYTLNSNFQKYDFNEWKATNAGNLILKRWDEDAQKNTIYTISKDNVSGHELTINSIVEGRFFEDENTISYIGLETKGVKRVLSIVNLDINPVTGEFTQKITPFTEGKIKDFVEQKNLLKEDKKNGNYLIVAYKTIIKDNDGSYYLICEENHMSQRMISLPDNKSSTLYTFNTLRSIIFKLDKKGDFVWAVDGGGTGIKDQDDKSNVYQGNHYYLDKKGEVHILHNTDDAVYITDKGDKHLRKDVFNNAQFGLFDNVIDVDGIALKSTFSMGDPRADIVDSRYVFTNQSMITDKDYIVFLLYHPETKGYKVKVLKK